MQERDSDSLNHEDMSEMEPGSVGILCPRKRDAWGICMASLALRDCFLAPSSGFQVMWLSPETEEM